MFLLTYGKLVHLLLQALSSDRRCEAILLRIALDKRQVRSKGANNRQLPPPTYNIYQNNGVKPVGATSPQKFDEQPLLMPEVRPLQGHRVVECASQATDM